MIRLEYNIANRIFFRSDNRRSSKQSICDEQAPFISNKQLRSTAIYFRSTSSISLIILIHYLILICIMIASVISVKISAHSNDSIVQDRFRFNRLDQHNHTKHFNDQTKNKMLNNQKTSLSSQAIGSVQMPLKRINLSTELNTHLVAHPSVSLSYSLLFLHDEELSSRRKSIDRSSTYNSENNNNKTNNQNRRSSDWRTEKANRTTIFQPTTTSSTLSIYRDSELFSNKTEEQMMNNTHQSIKSEQQYSSAVKLTISLLLTILIIATTVGNIFVIAAICLDKNLQSAQNYLVLSLAVADLAVALLVMPPCMVYEVYQSWVLGSEMCVFWNLVDVFSCTASILHLLAIALDRYWSVSSLHYSQGRSLQRMMYTIMAIWFAAAVVSMPPLLGVKDPEYEQRLQNGKCLMSQDVSYQIFATMSTFYGPSIIILFLYWKIYQVARKRIRNKPGNQASSERRQRAASNKEDKTDSFKRTNINTISSRLTMASTVDIPTSSSQNTSSETHSRPESRQATDLMKKRSQSIHEKHHTKSESNKELKQIKDTKSSSRQCDLIPKTNHRVYDSSSLLMKTKKDAKLLAKSSAAKFQADNCEEIKQTNHDLNDLYNRNSSINNQDRPDDKSHHKQEQIDNDMKLIQDQKQQRLLQNQSTLTDKTQQMKSSRSVVDEPIKISRRFRTKYKYIDDEEQDGQLGELNECNLNDCNSIKKCDNEYLDKLSQLDIQIEVNKQLDSNLINNLTQSNSPTHKLKLANNSVANGTMIVVKVNNDPTDNKFTNNSLSNDRLIASSVINKQASDVHQIKDLNNELRLINLATETQLNSSVNNSNTNSSTLNEQQRKQTNLTGSIQAIASTTIRSKNHSNTMAKKERKTAKILAIITGIFMICWLPFFINALLVALFPKTYQVSNILTSLFLWLGYFNSSLNPLVYTIFSPDFRNAFKKLLTRCK